MTTLAQLPLSQLPSVDGVLSAAEVADSAASIAASTWFQMSTCSPVVHGTAPHGSCIAAIAAAVSATCWAVMIPSTCGS